MVAKGKILRVVDRLRLQRVEGEDVARYCRFARRKWEAEGSGKRDVKNTE